MTLTTFLIALIISLLLYKKKKYRCSYILFLISTLLFLLIGWGCIPSILLQNLQANYEINPPIKWGNNNAIILLGEGTSKTKNAQIVEADFFAYGRIVKAISLYDDCEKNSSNCKLIVSGGDARHNGLSEASVYSEILKSAGIRPEDLILESNSMNTWQNAQFTSAIVRQKNIDNVLLVTSGIHLRRSLLYFSHFGMKSTPVRADYLIPLMSPVPLAFNFTVTDFVIHEYCGILRYHFYNMIGWNVEAKKPGSF